MLGFTPKGNRSIEFQSHLTQQNDEDWWQAFFEKHSWIFGYGLNYKILKTVQTQPRYGGITVTGKGTQKGNFLERTEAEVKFTVLVEIKRPNTQLLGSEQYRNGAWELGDELTGGVAQIQANCSRWEKEGSQTAENQEALLRAKIFTVQPKGILVIGHTNQLDQPSKRSTLNCFGETRSILRYYIRRGLRASQIYRRENHVQA